MRLNQDQLKVLNHTKGPLLVVAGAGTGKTSVIVEKINKLLDAGVSPESILAVTFTEKAANEMLDRVLVSHSGLLLDLNILTFNGYGSSLLKDYGFNFGLASSAKLLGPQAQIVFFRERLDEFKLEYFLPLSSSPDGIIEEILKLFSKLKQNLISPEQYQEFASNLLSNDEAKKLEKTKHLELSSAYKTYERLCRRDNVLDYDDQIYLSVKLLETRPNVRQQIQDRYTTIFIDEFQDTNPMQSRLIDLITKKDGQLIVVGDDDQSIYGFRGATVKNILSFKERYPKSKEVVLTENYRSHQAILDASYKLIQNNNPHRLESQLKINKRLTTKLSGDKPRLMRFQSTDSELVWIAKDISKRVKQSSDRSIAILTRSNSTANLVHQALDNENIEHQVVGASSDLYTEPVVRMLIELARTLAEPNNNTSLHHTLVSDIFNIPNSDISNVANQARYEHDNLFDLLKQLSDKKIDQALDLIDKLREYSASLTVGQLLWRAVSESGYKDRIFKESLDNDELGATVGVLNQYFKSLKEFEGIALQPTTNQYLLSLPALMAAGETTDNTLDISENKITVTTIHKAKGLEWNTVYIPYLTEGSFPMRPLGQGLDIPEELTTDSRGPADDHYQEERRVMYVAMTRARNNLTLSFSDTGKSGAIKKPSRFIEELFDDDTADNIESLNLDINQKISNVAEESVSKRVTPKSILNGNQVRLSVSQADALLTCPLNFYYKYILKAPEEPTTKTDYGSQLHTIFEKINRGRKDGSMPSLESVLDELKAGWQKAGYATKAQQERAFIQARKTVTNFYKQAKIDPIPKYIEQPFEVDLGDNLILHGRIDVIYGDQNDIEIQDYKTGDSVKDEKKAKSKTQSSQQLTLYALAWYKQTEIVPKVSLRFPDTNLTAVVTKQLKSLETIESKLNRSIAYIKSNNYPPGNNRHDYCIHPNIN